jgi:hypothetical protein
VPPPAALWFICITECLTQLLLVVKFETWDLSPRWGFWVISTDFSIWTGSYGAYDVHRDALQHVCMACRRPLLVQVTCIYTTPNVVAACRKIHGSILWCTKQIFLIWCNMQSASVNFHHVIVIQRDSYEIVSLVQ